MEFFMADIPVGMPQPSRQILSRAAEEFTCIAGEREEEREMKRGKDDTVYVY